MVRNRIARKKMHALVEYLLTSLSEPSYLSHRPGHMHMCGAGQQHDKRERRDGASFPAKASIDAGLQGDKTASAEQRAGGFAVWTSTTRQE